MSKTLGLVVALLGCGLFPRSDLGAQEVASPVLRQLRIVTSGSLTGEFFQRSQRLTNGKYVDTVWIRTPSGVSGVVDVELDLGSDELAVVVAECSTGWRAEFGRSGGVELRFQDYGWEGLNDLAVDRAEEMAVRKSSVVHAALLDGLGSARVSWQYSVLESPPDPFESLLGELSPPKEGGGPELTQEVADLLSFLFSAGDSYPWVPVVNVKEIVDDLFRPALQAQVHQVGPPAYEEVEWRTDRAPADEHAEGQYRSHCGPISHRVDSLLRQRKAW